MPYTAYLYGAYFGVRLASLIYCANIIAVGLFQLLHWLHAVRVVIGRATLALVGKQRLPYYNLEGQAPFSAPM